MLFAKKIIMLIAKVIVFLTVISVSIAFGILKAVGLNFVDEREERDAR